MKSLLSALVMACSSGMLYAQIVKYIATGVDGTTTVEGHTFFQLVK